MRFTRGCIRIVIGVVLVASVPCEAASQAIGLFYEQVRDPGIESIPVLELVGPALAVEGEEIEISAEAGVCSGCSASLYWQVGAGQLREGTTQNSVFWTLPSVPEAAPLPIFCTVQDGAGNIRTKRLDVMVEDVAGAGNATGQILHPNGSVTGDFAVTATAADPDGLALVTVSFVEGGARRILCGGNVGPCIGSEFTQFQIDPTAFGVTGPGPVTMRLFVEDSLGNEEMVDTHVISWNPEAPDLFTLTLLKDGDGDGTVSGGGIDCPPGCSTDSVTLPEGTSVTLTGSGEQFIGFTGEICYGTAPCTFSMFRELTVHASFALPESFGVLYTAPADGETGVGTTSQPTAFFNREVALGPNAGSITLTDAGGNPVPSTPVVHNTAIHRRLVLVLDSPLARGRTYQVTIPAGAVTDSQGTALASPVAFTFTTEVEGTPDMYLAAYPRHVMEGRETKVSIWFESPTDQPRTLQLSSGPAGQLLHPSEVVLPAGQVLIEFQVDTRINHGTLDDFAETLLVTEAEAGTESVVIFVENDTNQNGPNLRWLASSLIDDDDGDGVFESGESGEILFEVGNLGTSDISGVALEFEVVNTYRLSILGGRPFRCDIGFIPRGSGRSCSRRFRADDQLPTGDYFVKVRGTSSQGDVMIANARVRVVNNSLPDFILTSGPLTTNELPPGTPIELTYTANNRGDGFTLEMPVFEVFIEIEGQEQRLFRTYADVRGDVTNEQFFSLTFTAPTVPGAHPIRARINPAGAEHRPESDTTNNDAVELILHIAAPNGPPSLDPVPPVFAVNVGETLSFVVGASDPDGDPLIFSLALGAPPGMTLDPVTGLLTWTPACGQGPQTYPVEIRVADPEGLMDAVTASFVVGVQADLSITKTASTALALPGETVGFTVQVTNTGPSCVSGAGVTDLFEANLIDVSWTCSASAGSSCPPSGSGNINESSVGLLAGGDATYVITARIADAATGLVTNTANVAVPAGATDPNGGNDSDTASITLRDLDYGDAGDSSLDVAWTYPTRLVDDGARHGVSAGLKLGAAVDGETDGQPTLAADGDDLAGAEDEEGVTFVSDLVPCETADLEITASAPGLLSAWIDFHDDGGWAEPGDQVFTDQALAAGVNPVTLTVPCDAVPGAAFARFRLSTAGGLGFAGLALDGEVEDYAPIIQPILRTLTVVTAGSGGGGVTILPGGIPCGAGCAESFPDGTEVTLVVSPAVGSVFAGWSEPACPGTDPCALTLDADKTVTATFDLAPFLLTVSLTGNGAGSVTSQPAGIACPGDCSEEYLFGTMVTLTAVPDAGSFFAGWSDPACPGTGPCTVTLEMAKAVTATFSLVEHDLTVTRTGAGSGTVTSDPAGIDCGATCVAGFTHGTPVTLTASAEPGSQFIGWSGEGCAGTDPCQVTMDAPRVVNVRFDPGPVLLTVILNGAGTVTSNPPGIGCPADCSEELPPGTEVTLTAVPEVGSSFTGWSGVPCGTGPVCTLTVDGPTEATASFAVTCIDTFETGAGNWMTAAGPGDGGGTSPWSLVTSDSHSPTHAWFTADEALVKDQILGTAFSLTAPVATDLRLRFWHRFDTEAGFDGGVLEVSVDGGGSWFDVLAGNGGSIPPDPSRFTAGGYNSVLSDCCSSPLGLRDAWSGTSGGWVEVEADLSDFAGHDVLLRWRFGAGSGVAAMGWWIDDVAFSSGACPLRVVFQDGFESGDLSGWSSTVP